MFSNVANNGVLVFLFVHLIDFRLDKWDLSKCVGATLFEYQDILRDVFLLAKMTLAIGGLKYILDPNSNYLTFGTLVRISLIFCRFAKI